MVSLSASARDSEPLPAAMGKYIPVARLGKGGMADVFLAVARGPVGFNKLCVIKRLRSNDEEGHLSMFLDEARLAARLNHPNIVNTYEVGESVGQFFIAMEYLEGQSLLEVIKSATASRGGLDERVIALLSAHALRGLHYAHELRDFDGAALGVVHRDVSPHNVFVTYDGDVKMLDFGIAKATLNSTQTEAGVLKGKVRYMAPEQLGDSRIDRRADVFAFGIILWEMLARRHLFLGDTAAVLGKLLTEDVPTVRSIRPEASPELEAIAMKALRRRPSERYGTAEAMRADLQLFLERQEAVTEQQLAKLMTDLFAGTRETARERLRRHMARIAPSEGGRPVQLAELPIVYEESDDALVPPAARTLRESRDGSSDSALPAFRSPRRAWPVVTALVLAATAALMFRSAHEDVSATNAASQNGAIPLPRAPVVAIGRRLRVESIPAGARIDRDGEMVSRTPTEISLPPGPQTLIVSLDGYDTETVRIEANDAELAPKVVSLKKTATLATPASTASTAAPPSVNAPTAPPLGAVRSPARLPTAGAPPPPSKSQPAAAEKARIHILSDSE